MEATPWSPRHGHGFVYVKNTGNIFILGGDVAGVVGSPLRLVVSDVWRSRDAGATWELRAGRAPWPPRKLFGSFANNAGQLFVIGGDNGVPRSSGLNDVWRSDDEGRSWTAINIMSPWSARSSFASSFASSLLLYSLNPTIPYTHISKFEVEVVFGEARSLESTSL